MIYRFNTAQEK